VIIGSRRPSLFDGYTVAALAVLLLVAGLVLPRSFSETATATSTTESDALPKLELTITMRAMMILGSVREHALKRGLLFRSPGDLVPALIYDGDLRQRAEVRLKGDFVDHFQTDKWSWRVQLKNDGQVLGMRRFSLQAPNTRRYHWEALLMQHLRDEGVLAPRYEFVNLHVNGMDIGVMALEEHFSKELLEAQGRKEGVLLRFDEDEFWQDRDRNDQTLGIGKTGAHRDFSWRDARIRPFRGTAVERSPALKQQSQLGIGLLRALQAGTARPSEVMDVETTAKWLAVSEVWGFWHGLRWHNVRFYVNPYTLKLEPVAFDATSNGAVKGFVVESRNLLFPRVLLADAIIYEAYRRHLARITQPSALDHQLAQLQQLALPMIKQLRPEYPKLKVGFQQHIKRRVKKLFGEQSTYPSSKRILKKSLSGRESGPVKSQLAHTAAAYAQVVRQANGESTLELFTGLKEDVLVTELSVRTLRGQRPLTEFIKLKMPIVLAASYFDEGKRTVRIPLPAKLAANPETIVAKVAVPSDPQRDYTVSAIAYHPLLAAPVLPERAELDDLLKAHSFLLWDGERFSVPPGKHVVATPLIVPQRLTVEGDEILRPGLFLEAGAQLAFEPDALLLTWGSLQALGTADEPVVFTGVGGLSWRGITVLGDDTEVVLRHARIEQTTHAEWGPWMLTGGMTLHQSQVTLEHVLFAGTQAEDALNLVRSTFTMRDVQMRDTRSDGLDSDFSKGTLERCAFLRIGGDGIDLSGSNVSASDIEARQVHDKALSIGEASTFDAHRILVEGTGVAVVSKDASKTNVTDISVSDAEVAAFMSYSKKAIYGPSSLYIKGAKLAAGTKKGVVQLGGTLIVNGHAIPAVDLDVEMLYAGKVMRK